ncbi:MAG: hypothetical protein ACI8RC_003219 [Ilumatobacter sp.]|jgi:hypothetical protein
MLVRHVAGDCQPERDREAVEDLTSTPTACCDTGRHRADSLRSAAWLFHIAPA